MTSVRLNSADRDMLEGRRGEAAALAMRILVHMAEVSGATRFIDVARAHVDGGLYHGRAGLDFAERLVAGGGRVAIPTTLNVSSLDLIHPDLYRGDPASAELARSLMDAYVAMGCRPTWTCAPYQLRDRPGFGEHIAWAESNAIVFANSVIGARTDRYGDFIDICAALTGRVPDSGLHRDENRRAEIIFRLVGISQSLMREDAFFGALGHLVGLRAGRRVPAIDGLLPDTTEEGLKALGAAAAASGAVGMFHAIGITPEAPTARHATGDAEAEVVEISGADIAAARDDLTTAADGELSVVSLGTPHFSVAEFDRFVALLGDRHVHADIDLYVSTGRDVLAEVERRGWVTALEDAGVTFVVDTCTYVTPILTATDGAAMTNSAKWAYYAPGNLGVSVVFGTMEDCVRSAIAGKVVRDDRVWR